MDITASSTTLGIVSTGEFCCAHAWTHGWLQTGQTLAGRLHVELCVHCCDFCMARKGTLQSSRALLQSLCPCTPMERVTMDVLGPFPTTEPGNRSVLMAMDYFTKRPEAYAVPDQIAATLVEGLV